MRVHLRVIEPGTVVKVRQPAEGERGAWIIVGRVQNSGLDNPAYDVAHERSHRRRIFRTDRLRVTRRTARVPYQTGEPAA